MTSEESLDFVCPVTGRCWESRPEWVIVGPRSTYRFYVLDRRIVLCRAFGSTGREEVGWYCAAMEKIIQEYHVPGSPMVLMEDYTQLHSSDNGARQLYSSFHLRRQDIWKGVLFFGMNPVLKLLLRLSKRLYPLRMVVDTFGSYAQALDRACSLLDLPLRTANVGAHRGEFVWTSPNATVVFHPLDADNILRLVARGRFVASEIPDLFRAYETFLASQSPPPRQWYRLVDYAGMIDWEFMAMILTLRNFRRIDVLFPPRRRYIMHLQFGPITFLAITWLRWMNALAVVRDPREIVAREAWMQEDRSEGGIRGGRILGRIRQFLGRSRSRTARDLQTFISELQWDIVGVPRNPYEPTDPMHQVAASLLVVKSDFDALLVERDRRESDLDAARRRAEEVNRLQARFLANVSHEIRTPLNAVLGMGELLSDTALDSRQEDLLRMMRQSAQGLLAVINDILDLSRMEAGEFRLVEEPFDLDAVLDEVESMIGALATKKGLQFHMDRLGDHPEGLRGDAVRLRQILVNLGGNAVKFTEHGLVAIRVTGAKVPETGRCHLVIEVDDSGPGIPSDRVEELFRPFKQLDGSFTRRHGGTGLGLAIARNLAQRMGGDITVRPGEACGTVFVFEAQFERVERPAHSEAGESAAALNGRVLLAEDNLVNQKVALGLLAKLGLEAVAVDDGRAVLDILARRPGDFRCILMDIQMPFMDGMETARRIRRGEAGDAVRRIPIFALTAHAMDGDRETFLKSGMDGYLSKPIRLAHLRSTLEDVLTRSVDSNEA